MRVHFFFFIVPAIVNNNKPCLIPIGNDLKLCVLRVNDYLDFDGFTRIASMLKLFGFLKFSSPCSHINNSVWHSRKCRLGTLCLRHYPNHTVYAFIHNNIIYIVHITATIIIYPPVFYFLRSTSTITRGDCRTRLIYTQCIPPHNACCIT